MCMQNPLNREHSPTSQYTQSRPNLWVNHNVIKKHFHTIKQEHKNSQELILIFEEQPQHNLRQCEFTAEYTVVH